MQIIPQGSWQKKNKIFKKINKGNNIISNSSAPYKNNE